MRFRPCIDLHQGKVKQIVGNTLTHQAGDLVENYIADQDAAFFAELFKRDDLSGGHVIMLGPGNETQTLKALHAYPGGLQVGGGITAENATGYLEQGASHVIITSYVFHNGDIDYHNLERLVSEIGKDRLVLDLSCREKDGAYFVVTDKWQKYTGFELNGPNLLEMAGYCAEFLIHAVAVEGLRRGIDRGLVEKLGRWVTIPTTYAGGARTLSDLESVKQLGGGKLDLTIGSALDIFGGDLPYLEVVKWQKKTVDN
jgi:phosphoribosylformimino-5-aminoimidazole carboxamide ribotide isomerase